MATAEVNAAQQSLRKLIHLLPGEEGTILRLDEDSPRFRQYLATLGLVPGATVQVEEAAPFGGPLLVRMGRARYALSREVAAKIAIGTSF